MPEFNYSDITEEKRRVQEMRNKAKEQGDELKRNDIVSLILSQKNERDKAFVLALLYIISFDTDENLLVSLIDILFN